MLVVYADFSTTSTPELWTTLDNGKYVKTISQH